MPASAIHVAMRKRLYEIDTGFKSLYLQCSEQWKLYIIIDTALRLAIFVLSRELSSSRRLKIYCKYKESHCLGQEICPFYFFLYYVLDMKCPLSEVPLYLMF